MPAGSWWPWSSSGCCNTWPPGRDHHVFGIGAAGAFRSQALLGAGLYLGILGFNLAMTFLIGETYLGWVGVFIYLPFLTWLVLKLLPEGQK